MLVPAFTHLNRQHIAGTEPVFYRIQVILIQTFVFQHHTVESRNPDHGFGFESPHGVQGRIQVDPWLQYECTTHQDRRQPTGLSEDVKKGRITHDNIILGCKKRFGDLNLFQGRF